MDTLDLAAWGVLAPTRPPRGKANLAGAVTRRGLGGLGPGWDPLGRCVLDATGRGFRLPPRPTLRGWDMSPGTLFILDR